MGTVAFLRNYHFAKYLSKLFDSSFLITIKNISIPLKDEITNDFIEEYRVFNFDYRNLANLFSSKKNSIRNKTNAKNNSQKAKFIRKFFDSYPTNILFGEGGVLYIINSILRGIKLVRKNKITHLYSSYRPMADHLIAYYLKLIFPHLFWIADFRDPPVDDSRDHVYLKKLQWWFVKRLMKKANKVIAVSDGVTTNIQRVRSDAITVKNGIYKLFDFSNEKKYPKFTLSYTGSIYQKFHKPDYLFDALKTLLEDEKINKNNFQIVYAGKDSVIWDNWMAKYHLEDLSVNLAELSLVKAIKLQYQSHINVLFSWSNDDIKGLLSGKLFEYLATGNPIFSLINGSKDEEFEQIFKELNAGFVFYNNESDKIAKQINKMYEEWGINGEISHQYSNLVVDKYSWESKIDTLKELIK